MAEESDPIGTAKDNLVNDHVFKSEGFHAAAADLGPSLAADLSKSDLACIILQVHLREKVRIFTGADFSPMDYGLKAIYVTVLLRQTRVDLVPFLPTVVLSAPLLGLFDVADRVMICRFDQLV